jgi:effector-binding domain-containing protein
VTDDVSIVTVDAQPIASIPVHVAIPEIGSAFPNLDRVWEYVRAEQLDFVHNVFVYRAEADAPYLVAVGVQVRAPFDSGGEVVCSATPGGEVATAVHVGPYDRLGETHGAVQAWCVEHGRTLSDTSWEVYGDWEEDPAKLRTDVYYLLV